MLDFSNILIGIFRKGKGYDMKGKAISIIAGAAAIATIGITSLSDDDSIGSSRESKISIRTSRNTCRLETAYAVGLIQGWPVMIFVNEDESKTNAADRLESHVGKGISRILSYNKIATPPSDCTLTLFTSTNSGSGWNIAYPTAEDKQAATNALMASHACQVRNVENLPDGCIVSIGWLCYVTNGFWNVHTTPVSFSDIAALKGGWLYRERR